MVRWEMMVVGRREWQEGRRVRRPECCRLDVERCVAAAAANSTAAQHARHTLGLRKNTQQQRSLCPSAQRGRPGPGKHPLPMPHATSAVQHQQQQQQTMLTMPMSASGSARSRLVSKKSFRLDTSCRAMAPKERTV